MVFKCTALVFLGISALPFAASAFDESINRAPPFQVYQKDPKLEALLGSTGASGLCWPSSLAHRMRYLQKYSETKLAKLPVPEDTPAAVQKFVELCHTSLSGGTSQRAKIPCVTAFLQSGGYLPLAFIVGPSARGLPASDGMHNQLRPVEIADFRDFVKKDYGIILHVGWLKYDSGKRAWREDGSHSLNVYGFDYDHAWGDDKIVLKVANPNINYLTRPGHEFYDSVTVSPLERQPGAAYPFMIKWAIRGPGFNNPKHLAVIEDLFVFSTQPEPIRASIQSH